jgi:hypothetical protein
MYIIVNQNLMGESSFGSVKSLLLLLKSAYFYDMINIAQF